MNMTRLVVLANSRKQGNRCLAGIDLATGKWVRPVTAEGDGSITLKAMERAGCVPALLDIVEMPLDASGPDYGFESENKLIRRGKWRRIGTATVDDVNKFAIRPTCILHTGGNCVAPEVMHAKPFDERVTLQLVRTKGFAIREEWFYDKRSWIGIVPSGKNHLEVKITDLAFCEKLRNGHKPSGSCLLTMSLSMPYSPVPERPPLCWKLVAGVIELPAE